ncbi:MAG: tyrosine-type recombinase/integrase [Anaerolineales bacterium]|nr:tyrosine-type recombinase/integrase [Anaerolineales bacterium]
MDEAIGRYLAHLKGQGRSPNTLLAYHADLRQFCRILESHLGRQVQASDLSPESLAGYVSWLTQQTYRPATLARKTAAVRSFVEFLHVHDKSVPEGLTAGLRAPVPPRQSPRVLTPNEIGLIVDLASRSGSARGMRDAAILSLLYSTGLRAADAVRLKLPDIDLEAGTVRVPGSTRSPVALGASQAHLQRYLQQARQHLAGAPGEQALFLNQRGTVMSRQGLWLVVKRWSRAAGLGEDVSPHSLRHSLAHHLLGQGKSRREVQQILGLSSPNALRVQREGAAQ